MKYVNIRDSITKLLYDNTGYKVLIEEIAQGLDKKRPCFFVQLIPLQTINLANSKNRLINVDITFFSEKKKIDENLEIQERLESIFSLNLNVLDRSLLIKDLTFRTVNGTNDIDKQLHCIFTLDYFEGADTVEMVLDGTNTTVVTKQEENRLKALGYTQLETMKELEIRKE